MFRLNQPVSQYYKDLIESTNMTSIVSIRIKERLLPQKEIYKIKRKQLYSDKEQFHHKKCFQELKTIILQPEYKNIDNVQIEPLHLKETVIFREQTQKSEQQSQQYPIIGYVEKIQIIKNLQSMILSPQSPTQTEFKIFIQTQQQLIINIVNLSEFTCWKDQLLVKGNAVFKDKLPLNLYLQQLEFIQPNNMYYMNIVILDQGQLIKCVHQCIVAVNVEISHVTETYRNFINKLQADKLVQLVMKDRAINSFILVWNYRTGQTWVLQQINSNTKSNLVEYDSNFDKQMNKWTQPLSFYNSNTTQIVLSDLEVSNVQRHFKTHSHGSKGFGSHSSLNLPQGLINNHFSEQHNNHIVNLNQVLNFLQKTKLQESRINEVVIERPNQQMRPRSTLFRQRLKSSQFVRPQEMIPMPTTLESLNFIQQQQFLLLNKKELRSNQIQQTDPKLIRSQSSTGSRFKINKKAFTPFQIEGSQVVLGQM